MGRRSSSLYVCLRVRQPWAAHFNSSSPLEHSPLFAQLPHFCGLTRTRPCRKQPVDPQLAVVTPRSASSAPTNHGAHKALETARAPSLALCAAAAAVFAYAGKCITIAQCAQANGFAHCAPKARAHTHTIQRLRLQPCSLRSLQPKPRAPKRCATDPLGRWRPLTFNISHPSPMRARQLEGSSGPLGRRRA